MTALPGRPRRLSGYVGRAFAGAFVVTLCLVLGLYLVVDGTQRAGAVVAAQRHDVLGHLLRYYALQLPVIFVQIGPVVTLAAAAFALTQLRRRGELLPILASGVSLHRVLVPVLVAAAGLAGVAWTVDQWVTPEAAESVREEGLSTRREAQLFSVLVEDRAGRVMVYMGKYTPARATMENVHIFELADRPDGGWRYEGRCWAREAVHGPRGWELRGGYRRGYDAQGEPASDASLEVFDAQVYPRLTLLPYDVEQGAKLGMSVAGAAGLEQRASLSALWRLAGASDAPASPRVHLHARLAHPLAHLALLLLGLPLVLRRESRSMVLGALLAGAVCGAYFLLQALCFDLGVRGVIPPALAGWAPVGLVAAIGLTWYDALPT